MALIQSKQISKLIAGKLFINDFNFATITQPIQGLGVTDQLALAALTAGDLGTEVPVQNYLDGAAFREGFVITGRNLVEMFDADGMKFTDTGGNEVFGRLTQTIETPTTLGAQSAPADLLYSDFDSNPATYASKPAIVSVFATAIANYDISSPPGGRTAFETAYAASLADFKTQADALAADGAETTATMHATLLAALTNSSSFKQTKGQAASDVLNSLGEDATVYATKAAIVTLLSGLITAYDGMIPPGARNAEERAYGAELAYLNNMAAAADANVAMSVADAFAQVTGAAKADAAYVDGNFNVQFFVSASGVETAYSLPVSVDPVTVKMVIPYLYTFEHLPFDFATGLKSVYVNDDPTGSSASIKVEQVTVTAANTVDALAFEYKTGTRSTLFINGQVALSATSQYVIDPGTNKIVWSAATSGFSLMPTDEVFIEYETTGSAFP